jgi:hypothetical protein
MQKGRLKVPPFGCVIQVENPEEILSDKVRALLERPYIKGRDFYDIAFLTRTLDLKPENRLIQRKLTMYQAPFRLSKTIEYYLEIDKLEENNRNELIGALERDLSRFIPPSDLLILKEQHFSQVVMAVRSVFQAIQENGRLELGGFKTREETRKELNAKQKKQHR